MNFEPSWLEGPEQGNNANTRVVQVRVMNEQPLTPKQRGELANLFERHQQAMRLSVAGYHVRDNALPDGSHVRIQSNSGQHTIMVWPIGGGGRTVVESLFYCVPSSSSDEFDASADPKFSKFWTFRGATEPPPSMRPHRRTTDQPKLKQHPGNLTWYSASILAFGKPIVVSWYGRATRYGRMDYYGRHLQRGIGGSARFGDLYSPANTTTFTTHRTNWTGAFKSAVWINGVKRSVNTPVMSAALRDVDGALKLYVVTYNGNDSSAGLEVWVGDVGDPYAPSDITLALAFTIPFTVSSTAYSPSQPMWETLLQPLYFNASCTQIAGLVVCKYDSSINATAKAALPNTGETYFGVLLCTVNVDTEVTTFTSANANDEAAVTNSYTSSGGSPPDTESSTDVLEERTTRYAAVDFDGDQLVEIMVSQTITQTYDVDGTFSGLSLAATQTTDGTATARSQYRVYRRHDDVTLLSKDTGILSTGTMHTESATDVHPTNPVARAGSCSGYWEETLSDLIYWFVSVEGGDIRTNTLVIAEYFEDGASSYRKTWAGSTHWDPFFRISSPAYSMPPSSVTINSRARSPGLRFIVVRDAAVVATTSYALTSAAIHSRFGWYFATSQTTLPFSDNLGSGGALEWLQFLWAFAARAAVAADVMPIRLSVWGATIPVSCHPVVNVDNPYVNESAFSTDDAYGFYNVSSNGDIIGKFLFDGVAQAMDASLYFEGATDPVLSSPVFIDNVPLPELSS